MNRSVNIAVVVNKSWETEPVLNAMNNPKLRAVDLPVPIVINVPNDANSKMNCPRTIYKFGKNTNTILNVTVWCIEDLMDPTKNSSSSQEKYRVLPPVLAGENPDLVISVSTANSPETNSINGSVVIGANSFLHDGHPDNPQSNLKSPFVGRLLPSNVNPAIFNLIDTAFNTLVTSKFLIPPKSPASRFVCKASKDISMVSAINVTDYKEYGKVDEEALHHFEMVVGKNPDSIETTHAVVKISTDKPIIFISPITDRFGHFAEDVTDTQNYVAAFNGGIVLGQLLCSLYAFVLQGLIFQRSGSLT